MNVCSSVCLGGSFEYLVELKFIVSFVILLNTHRMNLLWAMASDHYNRDFMADIYLKALA